MKKVILDGLIDTLKVIPFLFVAFLILEFIEHKIDKKNKRILVKTQKLGPLFGGLLGAFPQCGFSAMATNLFSKRVITLGTLIAIYLSTSDEMLPLMISHGTNYLIIIKILLLKVIIGITFGFIIDFFCRKKGNAIDEIHHLCDDDDCHCDEMGIFKSSVKHTLNIILFILIANLTLNIVIYYIGEDSLSKILMQGNIFSYFLASLFGIIPNCASSVIITELYLNGVISIGNLLAGLLTGSGLGILLLFKTNKNLKENLSILMLIYFIGSLSGLLIDFLGVLA